MKINEIKDGINEARNTIHLGKIAIRDVLSLISTPGDIRSATDEPRQYEARQADALIAIKKELRDFNMTTRQWKER